jgi:hypothetical protein
MFEFMVIWGVGRIVSVAIVEFGASPVAAHEQV